MADWTASEWNPIIANLPGAHLLQTWEWAEVKSLTGWKPLPQVWKDSSGKVVAAAMVLQKPISMGGFSTKTCILYIPRGPVMDWADSTLRHRVLDDLQAFAIRKGAIFLKLDAELLLGKGEPGTERASENPTGIETQSDLTQRKWIFSNDQIQFRNTIWIDLSGTPEDWLGRMKQKSRYNIRLAEKKGVIVREGTESDLPGLYEMYAKTSVRDGFVIRPHEYYLSIWKKFMKAGMAMPLIAEVEGEAVAGMVLFWFAGKAWYLHGMSVEKHREKMPNHLLQWSAMRIARENGAMVYDLWGAPDVFSEQDGMWGVYRFKEGLGGEVIRTLGAWDYPARPILYRLYTQTIPKILDGMRKRGKDRTRREVNPEG
jgi:peptidoglycan pentaglycine glycine transferase (the first glycine)